MPRPSPNDITVRKCRVKLLLGDPAYLVLPQCTLSHSILVAPALCHIQGINHDFEGSLASGFIPYALKTASARLLLELSVLSR